jgi:hypothetical protein
MLPFFEQSSNYNTWAQGEFIVILIVTVILIPKILLILSKSLRFLGRILTLFLIRVPKFVPMMITSGFIQGTEVT